MGRRYPTWRAYMAAKVARRAANRRARAARRRNRQ